ncbi:hypothetical protein PG993_011409 [Apiospora rasikravindrae]|uniref:Uncharacterized protein n=1 Tax=Apiospora rasikravindrae TaxID=990691 RepID=A0ABR1SFT6_9PEZI
MDDHGDTKAPPHPRLLDSEDEEHPPGLPSYQEATSGTRLPPPSYFHPDTTTNTTPGTDSTITTNNNTTYPDEKARPYGHDDATPSPSSSSQQPAGALTFIISLQNASALLHKKILIRPAGGLANIGWEVEYTSKYQATMKRTAGPGPAREKGEGEGEEKEAAAQSRDVARLKYPEFIVPGWCGVTVTFLPHEAEVGAEAVPGRAVNFMHCTGVMATKYAMEYPVMRGRGGGQVQAQGGDEKQQQQQSFMAEKAMLGAGSNNPAAAATTQNLSAASSSPAAAAGGFDFGSLFSNNWTPFLTQYLVDESEEKHVLAQYTRSAPWATERGILKIFPQNESPDGTMPQFEGPAFIEGILISCAAMVGMQDRLGMVSSLVEAGAEAYAGKGKGRA